MYNLKKKKGFTFIEAMLLLGATSTVSYGAYSYFNISASESSTVFIKDALSIVKAVDHRIAVDGYAQWSQNNWSTNEAIANNLIKQSLTSVNRCNGIGGWTPRFNSNDDAKIIECGLWENKTFSDLNLSANMELDASNFIEQFNFRIGFNNQDSFENNFKNFRQAIVNNKETATDLKSGEFNFTYKSKTTNVELSTAECINAGVNCVLELSLNRNGGEEFLKLDGSNSIVGGAMIFVDTTGGAPIICSRWKNSQADGSGVWQQFSEANNCGIGLYNDTDSGGSALPVIAEVAAENGVFKNILLDKTCNTYRKDGNGVSVISGTSPCGIISDSEVIHVIENIYANRVAIEDGSFNVLNVKELISNNIETRTLEVTGLSEVRDLIITGDFTVKGAGTFGNTVDVGRDLYINANLSAKDVTANKIVVNNRISAPIGDFVNVNLDIQGLKNKVDDTRDDFNNIAPDSSTVTDPGLVTTPNEDAEVKGEFYGDWGDWVNVGNIHSCGQYAPSANDIELAVSFIQTRTCLQKQKRERKVFEVWTDDTAKLDRIETEYRDVNVSDSRQNVGEKAIITSTSVTSTDWREISRLNCKVITSAEPTTECKFDGRHYVEMRLDTTTNAGTDTWQAQWSNSFFSSGNNLMGVKIKDGYKYNSGKLIKSSFSNGIQKREYEICRTPNSAATQYQRVCDILQRKTITTTTTYSDGSSTSSSTTNDRILSNQVVETWADSCRNPTQPDCV